MSSGFISETELAERRRVRQEEWEKARQPNQPTEAPEEEYDHRSLFERLEEQKKKKEFEYEEAHRLKNMIKGLDDDEVDFLDLVDRSKMEEERKKTAEEEREMADFRNRVASLQEQGLEQRIQKEIRQPLKVNSHIKSGRTSQTKLLAGAVVKKRPLQAKVDVVSGKRSRQEMEDLSGCKLKEQENNETNGNKKDVLSEDEKPESATSTINSTLRVEESPVVKEGVLTCIGILPGMGTYDVSSDESDCSTDVEEPVMRYDLLGRRIEDNPVKLCKECKRCKKKRLNNCK